MTAALPHRVVLDPNVLISAAMTPAGALGRIVTLIDAGTVTPIVSQHLIDEVPDVLGRPKLRRYPNPAIAEAFIAELSRIAEWHGEPADPPHLCRDPDDDYLIALAVASQAEVLVSGDRDLHALQNSGIEIITSRGLLDRVGN